ncbi:MAG TPA: hypothetical protein VM901_01300 [Bdellovibrionota bacterium]|nr:hypothetical protein [Bdellovibrionota bacterium]
MVKKLKRWLGISHWLPHWRGELEEALQQTQTSNRVQLAVVVAKESDSYSEILFLLTLLGLGIGSLASYLAQGLFESNLDMLSMPLLGFASGVLVYQFRSLYVQKLATKAVRDRVANKAKAFFYDYLSATNGPLFLLYISEVENEAYFVGMPQLLRELGEHEKDIQSALHRLVVNYNPNDPIPPIKVALKEIAQILSDTFTGDNLGSMELSHETPRALVFMPSDSASTLPTVVLKGTKDIN